MSSFSYLSKAALAAAAAATATGEAVDHIQRLSSSSEEENPFQSEMKLRLPMFGVVFVALVIGIYVYGNINDHQQPSFQPDHPKWILQRLSIEPALNFTNGLTLAGEADHPECTVCLSEFVEGEDIRILSNCRHGFHLNCIETWLQSSQSSCPTCRTSCVETSVNNNPPENQQQHNDHVDLEAANPPEIEMVVLQQHRLNDIDVAEAANLPEPEVVVLEQQQHHIDVDLEAANPPEI